VAIRRHEHANGYVVYESSRTRKVVRVWKDDLDAIAEVCEMCDQNNPTSAMARVVDGDFSYRTLERALSELRTVRDAINEQGIRVDGDDYIDLLTAIDDLEGITRRVRAID
jgi:hypothetical protein